MNAPRVGPTRGSVVALALVCMVCPLTACGGDDAPARNTTNAQPVRTASPAPSPEARKDRITITRPKPGSLLHGARPVAGGFAVGVAVAGRAAPDTTVLIDGGCFRRGCNSTARAGADGHWSGRVVVRGSAGRPTARIDVLTPISDPLDSVTVRLEAPPAAPEPRTPAARTTEAEPAVQATATPRPAVRPRRLVLVGDSLAVGIEALLPGRLAGWSFAADTLTGRPLADGMRVIEGMQFPLPTVLAVSLFTNDDPSNLSALESAVRETVTRVGEDGCAVWATIVRPPLNGVSYAAANARLEAMAAQYPGRLILVPWAAAAGAHPEWMRSDGVHPTPAGYQVRARLYARAARSCGT